VRQHDYLEFLDLYADADNAVKQAVAARKQLRDRIAAIGIPLPAFDRTRHDSEKSGEVRETEDRWYRRMMAWRLKPVGFQASMDMQTDDPNAAALNVHELKRIDNEGIEAGQTGRPRTSNSYTPGTEAYQRWDNAWMRGDSERESSGSSAGSDSPRRSRGRPRKDGTPAQSRQRPADLTVHEGGAASDPDSETRH